MSMTFGCILQIIFCHIFAARAFVIFGSTSTNIYTGYLVNVTPLQVFLTR